VWKILRYSGAPTCRPGHELAWGKALDSHSSGNSSMVLDCVSVCESSICLWENSGLRGVNHMASR
jgi:hypothetical protein